MRRREDTDEQGECKAHVGFRHKAEPRGEGHGTDGASGTAHPSWSPAFWCPLPPAIMAVPTTESNMGHAYPQAGEDPLRVEGSSPAHAPPRDILMGW